MSHKTGYWGHAAASGDPHEAQNFRPSRLPVRIIDSACCFTQLDSYSSGFTSFRSAVSKPSVNQP
jgi:hypothetical protein